MLLVSTELTLQEKTKLISGGTVIVLFFLKILPSPYPFLLQKMPMSLAMFVTIFIISFSVALAVFLSQFVLNKIENLKK